MKNTKLIAVFAILITTLLSCTSSFEIADQWKNDKFKTLKGQKILVIYKTENMVTKQRFEQDVATQLRKAGIDATESYKAFPQHMHKQVRDEKEMEQVVKMITDAGFHGVVLTTLKDQAQQTESTTTGGYTTGGYYGGYYPSYYGGFGGYYGSVYGYGHGYGGYYNSGVYVPQETTTRVVDVYLFETVTYNLDLPDTEELVGVISVKLTDPESYSEVAGKYAKAIAGQFTEEVKDK